VHEFRKSDNRWCPGTEGRVIRAVGRLAEKRPGRCDSIAANSFPTGAFPPGPPDARQVAEWRG